MKPRVIALALLAASAVVPAANAAPWRVDSYTINPGTFHSAVQYDAGEDFVLIVECHEQSGRFQVMVESPHDWELDASYAPDVPTRLLIDGTEITDVLFHFDERQLVEGIVAEADGQTAAFTALLLALGEATDAVELAYFDRSASFSAEGLPAAMAQLDESCR